MEGRKNVGLVVIGLVLFTLFILVGRAIPGLMDENRYKEALTAVVHHATGRTLTMNGAVRLEWKPWPVVVTGPVHLDDIPGAPLAEADEIRLSLALWPLLWGEAIVTDVVVRQPVVRLAVDDFLVGTQPLISSTEAGFHLKVKSVHIENGILAFHDPGLPTFKGIDGTITDTVTGSYGLTGFLRLGEKRAGVTWKAGRTFSLDLALPDSAGTLTLAGLAPDGGTPSAARARIKGTGPDLAEVFRILDPAGSLPASLHQPFRLEGTLAIETGHRVTVDDIVMHVGTTAGGGRIVFYPADRMEIEADLAFSYIDLDGLAALFPGSQTPTKNPLSAWADAWDRARALLFGLPRETILTLVLSAAESSVHGRKLHNVQINLTAADQELAINQISASLPQGGMAAVFGFLTPTQDGQPRIDLTLELDGAKWLTEEAGSGTEKAFAMRARIEGTAEEMAITTLDGQINRGRVTGTARLRLAERPVLAATVRMDTLDFSSPLHTFPWSLFFPAPQTVLKHLGDFDASLDMHIGVVETVKMPWRGATLKARLENGTL